MVAETEKTKDSKISSQNAKTIKFLLVLACLFFLVIIVVELSSPPKRSVVATEQAAAQQTQGASTSNRFKTEDPFEDVTSDYSVDPVADYDQAPEDFSSYRQSPEPKFYQGEAEIQDSGFRVNFERLGEPAGDKAAAPADAQSIASPSSYESQMQEVSDIDREIAKIDNLITTTKQGLADGSYVAGLQAAGENKPNQQGRGKQKEGKGYGYHKPSHCNNLRAGTVIKGYIDQYLSSDYPNGNFLGRITHTVYDPQREHALILQGDKFIGQQISTGNPNEIIEQRLGIAINKVLFQDGSYLDLGGLTAGDVQGLGALPASDVNRHLFAKFAGLVAYALVGTTTSYEGTGITNDRSFESELGDSVRQQVKDEANKYLSLTNTRTLEQGTPLTIIIQKGVCIPPQKKIRSRYERY